MSRQFTLRSLLFVTQVVATICCAGLLATSGNAVERWNWLVVLPAYVWMLQVLWLWLLTRDNLLAGAIGLSVGHFFIVADGDWGVAPVFWFIWFSHSVGLEINFLLFEFGPSLFAACLFTSSALVKTRGFAVLLRCFGVVAILAGWYQIAGEVPDSVWKSISSAPMIVYVGALFSDCLDVGQAGDVKR